MGKLPTFLAVGASLLLLTPLASSQAQFSRGNSRLGAFSGGGGGRDAAIASAPAARGGAGGVRGFNGSSGSRYYGRGGYGYGYGRSTRYYYRGGYYLYDPFFFGGFGYPSYYYGAGYGLGYYGAGYGFGGPAGYGGYPGGYYGDRVYNGRIVDESGRGGDREGDGRGYSPGSMASAVQRELKERGYYKGRIDGQFGESTSRALRAFQRDKGLSVNGRLNERTLGALGFEQR